ncbi:hypothetical protein HD806DRAFT_525661 [Xylariaceae sp. AK1471]|nr:hypothetical protein HD806DRAFT_525661 [Xylariaceae sp. AK1471]
MPPRKKGTKKGAEPPQGQDTGGMYSNPQQITTLTRVPNVSISQDGAGNTGAESSSQGNEGQPPLQGMYSNPMRSITSTRVPNVSISKGGGGNSTRGNPAPTLLQVRIPNVSTSKDVTNQSSQRTTVPVQFQGQSAAGGQSQAGSTAAPTAAPGQPHQFGSMPFVPQRFNYQPGQNDSPIPASPSGSGQFGYYGTGYQQQPPEHARPGGIPPMVGPTYGNHGDPFSYGPPLRPYPEIHRYGDERDLMTPQQIAERENRQPTPEEPSIEDVIDTAAERRFRTFGVQQGPGTPQGRIPFRRPAVLGPMPGGLPNRRPAHRHQPSNVLAANLSSHLAAPPAVYRSPVARSGQGYADPTLHGALNPPVTPGAGFSSSPFGSSTPRGVQRPFIPSAPVAQQTPSRAPIPQQQPETPKPPRTQDVLRHGAHEQSPGTPMPMRAPNFENLSPSVTVPGSSAPGSLDSNNPHAGRNFDDPFSGRAGNDFTGINYSGNAENLPAIPQQQEHIQPQPQAQGPSVSAIVREDGYDIFNSAVLARVRALCEAARYQNTPSAIFTFHQFAIADELFYGGIWTQSFMINGSSIIEYHQPEQSLPVLPDRQRRDRRITFRLIRDARGIQSWAAIARMRSIIPGRAMDDPPVDFEGVLNLMNYIFDRVPFPRDDLVQYAQVVAPQHVTLASNAENQNQIALSMVPGSDRASTALLVERNPTVIASYGGISRPILASAPGSRTTRAAARSGPAAGTRSSARLNPGGLGSSSSGPPTSSIMATAAMTTAATTITSSTSFPAPIDVGALPSAASTAASFPSFVASMDISSTGNLEFNPSTAPFSSTTTTAASFPAFDASIDISSIGNSQNGPSGVGMGAGFSTATTTVTFPSLNAAMDWISDFQFDPTDFSSAAITTASLPSSVYPMDMSSTGNLEFNPPVASVFSDNTTTAASFPPFGASMDISSIDNLQFDPSSVGMDAVPSAAMTAASLPFFVAPMDLSNFGNMEFGPFGGGVDAASGVMNPSVMNPSAFLPAPADDGEVLNADTPTAALPAPVSDTTATSAPFLDPLPPFEASEFIDWGMQLFGDQGFEEAHDGNDEDTQMG